MTAQRIVLHAGFHKTGTTAVQDFLHRNGPHLWPHMAIVTNRRIKDVLRVATLHSTLGDPLSLTEFGDRWEAFLRGIDIGQRRHLCISAEDLCGLIPGRNGQRDYEAAPALLRATRDRLVRVFGPTRPVTVVLSTRAPAAWLRSSYWQNLRVSELTMDFDAYAATYAGAADLDRAAARIARALDATPVVIRRLEDSTAHPFGPAGLLLDHLPLPAATRAALSPVARRNATPPPDLVDAVLHLNRAGLDANLLAARKSALVARAT